MKRTFILVLLTIGLFLPTICSAEFWEEPAPRVGDVEPSGFYIGFGVVAAFENFDDNPNVQNADHGDVTGINPRVGYYFNENFALELDYYWLPDWESEGTYIPYSRSARLGLEREIQAWFVEARYSHEALRTETIRPYVSGGIGWISGVQKNSASDFSYNDDQWITDDKSDAGVNLGMGVELFPDYFVCLDLNVNHMWGINELDDAKYFYLSVSAIFRL